MWSKLKPYLIEYVVAALVAWVLASLLFAPIWLGGRFIYAGDMTGSDLLDMNLPFRYLAAQSVKEGSWPLWRPEIGCGLPLLAEGQAGVFYPTTLPLFLFFSVPWASNLSIISALALAAWGGYVLGRVHGLSRYASALTGCTFAFSPIVVFRLKHLNMLQVISWMPLSIAAAKIIAQAAYELALESTGTGPNAAAHLGSCHFRPIFKLKFGLLLLVVCWTMQILAGHPHVAYISMLACFIYDVLLVVREIGQTHLWPMARRLGAVILAGIVLSVLLGAVQLYPTYEYSQLASRGQAYSWKSLSYFPFLTKHFRLLLNPFSFGNSADKTKFGAPPAKVSKDGIFWESMPYIGLTALILIAMSLIGRDDFEDELDEEEDEATAELSAASKSLPAWQRCNEALTRSSVELLFLALVFFTCQFSDPMSHLDTTGLWWQIYPLLALGIFIAYIFFFTQNDPDSDSKSAEKSNINTADEKKRTSGHEVQELTDSDPMPDLTNSRARVPGEVFTAAAIFLILALGTRGFFYWFLWKFAPGFNLFRFAVRFLIPFGVMASLWAGYGVDTLLAHVPFYIPEKWSKHTRKIQIGTGVLLCLLTFANFYWTTNNYVSYPSTEGFNTPEAMAALQDCSRVATPTMQNNWAKLIQAKGWRNAEQQTTSFMHALAPDSAAFWGVKQETNRTVFEGGSCLNNYSKLQKYIKKSLKIDRKRPLRLTDKLKLLYKLENVSHVVSLDKVVDRRGKEFPLISKVALKGIKKPLRIYKINEPLPRAYLVPNYTVDKHQQDASNFYNRHKREIQDGNTCILCSSSLPASASTSGAIGDLASSSLEPSETCQIIKNDSQSLKLEVNVQKERVLLFTENFYPAWRATLDGRPLEIHQANYCFMGCLIPPGKHTVSFDFISSSFRVGLLISALTGLVVLALAGLSFKKLVSQQQE